MLADSGAGNVPMMAGIGGGVILVGVLLLVALHLFARARGLAPAVGVAAASGGSSIWDEDGRLGDGEAATRP